MTMPKRSRFRRILKWAGAGMCVLICTAIVASWHWQFGFSSGLPSSSYEGKWGRYHFYVQRSGVVIGRQENRADLRAGSAFRVDEYSEGWFGNGGRLGRWLPYRVNPWLSISRFYWIPLWLPLLLAGVPTLHLFWRDRRRIPPGHCQRCGYNLTGNVSGVCSECGTECKPDASAT